jgi:hypothetical protein
VSREGYPVSYRILCLKDGIVLKLRYQDGAGELVMANDEAESLAVQLLASVRERKSREGVITGGEPPKPPEPPEPPRPCPGFRWIGQPYTSCDRCGLPYWEHSHEERLAPGASLGAALSGEGLDLVPIAAESAAACKRRWEGSR